MGLQEPPESFCGTLQGRPGFGSSALPHHGAGERCWGSRPLLVVVRGTEGQDGGTGKQYIAARFPVLEEDEGAGYECQGE